MPPDHPTTYGQPALMVSLVVLGSAVQPACLVEMAWIHSLVGHGMIRPCEVSPHTDRNRFQVDWAEGIEPTRDVHLADGTIFELEQLDLGSNEGSWGGVAVANRPTEGVRADVERMRAMRASALRPYVVRIQSTNRLQQFPIGRADFQRLLDSGALVWQNDEFRATRPIGLAPGQAISEGSRLEILRDEDAPIRQEGALRRLAESYGGSSDTLSPNLQRTLEILQLVRLTPSQEATLTQVLVNLLDSFRAEADAPARNRWEVIGEDL